jgi:hypothetical protein
MKEKKMRQNEKKQKASEKNEEKKEKLKEIDKQNEKYKKKILKKIEIMEKKKLIIDKEKGEHYQKMRNIRNNYLKETNNNKILISKEEDLRREDILYFENYKFDKALGKDSGNIKKRAGSQYRTIASQKDEEQKMKDFMKAISSLQDESIIKKNDKQKRALYNEKVRKEREEKRKEEEKKLEKLGLI